MEKESVQNIFNQNYFGISILRYTFVADYSKLVIQ